MSIETGSTFRRLAVLVGAVVMASLGVFAADMAEKRWKEDELVKAYGELVQSGGLETAIRAPALPKDPPQAAFLDALAWYAAGAPKKAGNLTRKQLDVQIGLGVDSYRLLLKAKVEKGEDNDYARTRTWKLVQKYTLLREEMLKPSRNGRYAYPALHKEPGGPEVDAWDREHTLRSPDEFAAKVCRASFERPVLVKYGNTNCTQCMLFEIIGSVKEIADNPAHKGAIDVYKVWFGFRPDEGFAGRIRDPERLEALAKAEGVTSSPTFIVYRNGRRYTCGDAFPDESGMDARLESCLKQDFGEAPMAGPCDTAGTKDAPQGAGR